MSRKLYKSTICPKWPLRRQEEVIASNPASESIDIIFCDLTKPYQRKPEFLKERQQMVRPTTRNGGAKEIHTASLACLAYDAEDLLALLTAAGDRGASVYDISANLWIKPNATSRQLKRAAEVFAEQRSKAKDALKGKAGGDASAAKRKAAVKAAANQLVPCHSDYDSLVVSG